MANDLNQCNFTGNLGRDPEIRHTPGGMAIANISIAVGGREKKGDQWEDSTEWVPCVCFGKTAENVGKYLVKGSKVRITGRFKTSSWEKDGEKRYKSEIVIDGFNGLQMLGGSRSNQENNSNKNNDSHQNQPSSQPTNQTNDRGFEDFDDDIPF